MKIGPHILAASLALTVFGCAPSGYLSKVENSDALPEFNKIVLDVIGKYPTDSTHRYWWPRRGEGNYSGSTQDLYLCGELVMKGEPLKRTFCCGLTLEVFLVSYEQWLEKHGGENASLVSPESWQQFQKLWFVQNTNGPGPSAALEEFHLGQAIDPELALPGDFVQIWRVPREGRGSPSGHSVIFLDWVRDNPDEIQGMRYWSTQESTNGIHENVEYFGSKAGIAGAYTYFARVVPATKTSLRTDPPKSNLHSSGPGAEQNLDYLLVNIIQ